MISRQCPVDATRLHRDKRGAIGERPFLVGTLGVERASLLKQLAADGHNFNVILISEQFQKSCKYRTVPWLTQPIADFRQLRIFSSYQRGHWFSVQCPRASMPLVLGIE